VAIVFSFKARRRDNSCRSFSLLETDEAASPLSLFSFFSRDRLERIETLLHSISIRGVTKVRGSAPYLPFLNNLLPAIPASSSPLCRKIEMIVTSALLGREYTCSRQPFPLPFPPVFYLFSLFFFLVKKNFPPTN